jgi:hypothetical protein
MPSKSLMTAAAIVGALVIGFVSPANAAEDFVIDIPESVLRPPPNPAEITTEEVPGDLVGRACLVTLVASNNDSVHEGNNLIVSSGDEEVIFENVESQAFQTTTAEGEIVLGETVTLELAFGKDRVSSGGLKLTFDCSDRTTTSTTSTTSTMVPTSVATETTIAPSTPPAQVLPTTQSASSEGAAISITG